MTELEKLHAKCVQARGVLEEVGRQAEAYRERVAEAYGVTPDRVALLADEHLLTLVPVVDGERRPRV